MNLGRNRVNLARPESSPYDRPMKLDDEHNWMLVCAPDEVSSASLARAWGVSASTVTHARNRIRRDGWTCPVDYVPCVGCGEWLTNDRIRTPRRRYHDGCRREETRRIARRHHERRWASWDDETRKDVSQRGSDYSTEVQEETRAVARQHRAPWTADEDAVLIARTDANLAELAHQLGRTYWAIKARRDLLRRQGLIEDTKHVRR